MWSLIVVALLFGFPVTLQMKPVESKEVCMQNLSVLRHMINQLPESIVVNYICVEQLNT